MWGDVGGDEIRGKSKNINHATFLEYHQISSEGVWSYLIDAEEIWTNMTKYHQSVWNRWIMQISWSVSREITVENQTLNQSFALSALTWYLFANLQS